MYGFALLECHLFIAQFSVNVLLPHSSLVSRLSERWLPVLLVVAQTCVYGVTTHWKLYEHIFMNGHLEKTIQRTAQTQHTHALLVVLLCYGLVEAHRGCSGGLRPGRDSSAHDCSNSHCYVLILSAGDLKNRIFFPGAISQCNGLLFVAAKLQMLAQRTPVRAPSWNIPMGRNIM